MVLNGIVGAAGKPFRDLCPLVTKLAVRLHDDQVLLFLPSFLADVGVEVIVPSFAALAGGKEKSM